MKKKLVKPGQKMIKKVFLYDTKEGGSNTNCFGCQTQSKGK